MKIFIIEDEVRLPTLININLSLEGFETAWVFADAESASKNDGKEKPDLIYLISCCRISGFEMQSRIRSSRSRLFLTARTSLQDRLLGLELGGDDYITKPFDNREPF